MKYTIFLVIVIMIFSVFLFSFLPQVVFAQAAAATTDAGGGATAEARSGSGGGATVTLDNPLGINDPRDIIGYVIKALLGIVGSLALAVFILGGFTWITSTGNEEKITKGKNMIMWATFGLVVVFFSYALVTFVLSAITGVDFK